MVSVPANYLRLPPNLAQIAQPSRPCSPEQKRGSRTQERLMPLLLDFPVHRARPVKASPSGGQAGLDGPALPVSAREYTLRAVRVRFRFGRHLASGGGEVPTVDGGTMDSECRSNVLNARVVVPRCLHGRSNRVLERDHCFGEAPNPSHRLVTAQPTLHTHQRTNGPRQSSPSSDRHSACHSSPSNR
jgi:hypothetical protein